MTPLRGSLLTVSDGDPYQQECKDDEIAAEIVAKPTNLKVCTKVCKQDADCPTDTCPGVQPKPACFLQDLHGETYCGLPCQANSTTTHCSFDEHMVCEQEAGQKTGSASLACIDPCSPALPLFETKLRRVLCSACAPRSLRLLELNPCPTSRSRAADARAACPRGYCSIRPRLNRSTSQPSSRPPVSGRISSMVLEKRDSGLGMGDGGGRVSRADIHTRRGESTYELMTGLRMVVKSCPVRERRGESGVRADDTYRHNTSHHTDTEHTTGQIPQWQSRKLSCQLG